MKMKMLMTDDGFVWKILTYNEAKAVFSSGIFELFELYNKDFNTEALIESLETLDRVFESGGTVGIEVGSLYDCFAGSKLNIKEVVMNDWKVTKRLDSKVGNNKEYYTYSVNGFSSPIIFPDQFKTAQLMASAKDLLEAIKLVLDVAVLEIPNYEESNSYAQAVDAINRAEGGCDE